MEKNVITPLKIGSSSGDARALPKFINSIKQSPSLLFGIVGIIVIVFFAVFAKYLTAVPADVFGEHSLLPPGSKEHFLGTNHLGQDIWSMLLYGARTSLMVAVISALISGVLGILVGGISGYFGGVIDVIISEIINVFLMIPTLFLILLIIAMFGSNIYNVMIVIGLTSWPSNAKLMRAQALSLRERTFIKSAIAMGENRFQILFKYIIPNGIFPVIANTTMSMANAILTEASLSFLGLGDPSVISWGQMIFDGKAYITSGWWVATFAGIAIVIIVLLFYLIGDGLNQILNPKAVTKK